MNLQELNTKLNTTNAIQAFAIDTLPPIGTKGDLKVLDIEYLNNEGDGYTSKKDPKKHYEERVRIKSAATIENNKGEKVDVEMNFLTFDLNFLKAVAKGKDVHNFFIGSYTEKNSDGTTNTRPTVNIGINVNEFVKSQEVETNIAQKVG